MTTGLFHWVTGVGTGGAGADGSVVDARAAFAQGMRVRLSPAGRRCFGRLTSRRGLVVGVMPNGHLRIRRDGLPEIETWPACFWERDDDGPSPFARAASLARARLRSKR